MTTPTLAARLAEIRARFLAGKQLTLAETWWLINTLSRLGDDDVVEAAARSLDQVAWADNDVPVKGDKLRGRKDSLIESRAALAAAVAKAMEENNEPLAERPRQTPEELISTFAVMIAAILGRGLPASLHQKLAALIAARDAEIAEEAARRERERCAGVVNDARFATHGYDLRELVAEIKAAWEALAYVFEIASLCDYELGEHEAMTDYTHQVKEWTCFGCAAKGESRWPKWELQFKHEPGCRYLLARAHLATPSGPREGGEEGRPDEYDDYLASLEDPRKVGYPAERPAASPGKREG